MLSPGVTIYQKFAYRRKPSMSSEMPISIGALIKWGIAFCVAQWFAVDQPSRTMLIALVALMAMDYITGLASAIVTHSVNSDVAVYGLIRKGLILALILTLHILESAAGIELHLELMGALGFVVNEAISIVENCARAGIPVPAKAVEVLITVKRVYVHRATPEQIAELTRDGAPRLHVMQDPPKPPPV